MKTFKVFFYTMVFLSLCSCKVEEVILYGDISGTVTDAETSEPIQQAKLKLISTNDSTFAIGDGSYLLNNIETGSYKIQASKQSYEKTIKNVTVDPAETTEIDFALSLLPWPEVSVTYIDFGYEDISGSFTIRNVGAGTLVYSCQSTLDWINFSPQNGEATDEVDTITVTIDRAALSEETYKEKFRILSLSGEDNVWDTVNVYLNGLRDTDGNYYKVVTIGTQTWMAENLNTGKMQHFTGDFVLSDNNITEKYCYGNSEANCETYGGLYSWGEMMDYVSDDVGIFDGDVSYNFYTQQGICPEGWHIPTREEWETLENFVVGDVGGAKLKADSPLWVGDTITKTDEFGFSVLPGGGLFANQAYTILGFNGKGEHALIWYASRTATAFNNGQYFWLMENVPSILWYDQDSEYATSVRCIKDSE